MSDAPLITLTEPTKCIVCGLPRDRDARGLIIRENGSSLPRAFSFQLEIPGCEEHPQVSVCFNTDGSICVSPPRGYKRSDRKESILLVRE